MLNYNGNNYFIASHCCTKCVKYDCDTSILCRRYVGVLWWCETICAHICLLLFIELMNSKSSYILNFLNCANLYMYHSDADKIFL